MNYIMKICKNFYKTLKDILLWQPKKLSIFDEFTLKTYCMFTQKRNFWKLKDICLNFSKSFADWWLRCGFAEF